MTILAPIACGICVTAAVIHFDAGHDTWGFACLVLAGVVAFVALT